MRLARSGNTMYWVFVRVLGAKGNINETQFFDDLSENFDGQAEQVSLILLQLRGHFDLESERNELYFPPKEKQENLSYKQRDRANRKVENI
jgi:hypothetical protein